MGCGCDKLLLMILPTVSIKGACHSSQEVVAGNRPAEVFLIVVDVCHCLAVGCGKTRRTAALKLPSENKEYWVHIHPQLCSFSKQQDCFTPPVLKVSLIYVFFSSK